MCDAPDAHYLPCSLPQRYCRDNPSKFRNADAAYMLAFAIIMLNTDAHNPMAERRLGKPDFVAMCYQQTDEGMAPVLPQDQVGWWDCGQPCHLV